MAIGSDGPGSGGRQSWDVFVFGKLIATRHSLSEARSVVEDLYGEVPWYRVVLPFVEVEHPTLGPTTEFTAPRSIVVVDSLHSGLMGG